MKRCLILLVALMLTVSLCACGGASENSEQGDDSVPAKVVELDLDAEATAIISKYSLSGGSRYSSASQTPGEYLDEDLILSYYGDAAETPDFTQVEAYAVYIDETKPIKPCEFGIFKMKDGADAENFVEFLKARIALKLENAKAYPSMDTEPLKTAVFTVKGGYVWYAVVKGGNADIDKDLKGRFE